MRKSPERFVVEEYLKANPDASNGFIMDALEIYFKYDRQRISDILHKIRRKNNG